MAPRKDITSLQGYIKEHLNIARVLLEIQKEAQSLIPPPQLTKLHELYSQLSPAYLRRFWNSAAGVKDLVEGRFSGTRLDISIDLNVPEQGEVIDELAHINSIQQEPKGACFIATAAYGSEMQPSVLELRRFRDGYLLRHAWGRRFVAIYERASPTVAHLIEQSASLRWAMRRLLIPVVYLGSFFNRLNSRQSSERRRQERHQYPPAPGTDKLENPLPRMSGGQQTKNRANSNAKAANARLSAHRGGIVCDAGNLHSMSFRFSIIAQRRGDAKDGGREEEPVHCAGIFDCRPVPKSR